MITVEQTQKILSGNQNFSHVGFSMLITRLKEVYAKDSSQSTLQKCTDEIDAFLQKYATIISEDLAVITEL